MDVNDSDYTPALFSYQGVLRDIIQAVVIQFGEFAHQCVERTEVLLICTRVRGALIFIVVSSVSDGDAALKYLC